jgi:hypothetical protein
MCAGGYFVYRYEEKTITELNRRCAEANNRLNSMVEDEEKFIDNKWPNRNSHISMQTNLADYLRAKYMQTESSFEDYEIYDDEGDDSDLTDYGDESENLYV